MNTSVTENEKSWYHSKLKVTAVVVVVIFAWLQLQVPDNAGPWRSVQARTASVEFSGRDFTVYNLRDFRYDDKGQPVSREYLEQDFTLDNLERVWIGLSHFGSGGLAHTFLSFEFLDGTTPRYLALSIEARLRPDQNYKPLAGLFRNYTKISILATEEDVIGLRSHIRGERVLLYPVNASPAMLEKFFLAIIEDVNELHESPAFYNTVLDNCLTNLLKHTAVMENMMLPDYRVVFPGQLDRLTYALQITPADIPFADARRRATVDPGISQIDDAGFSTLLRCGWNEYLCQ